MRGRFSRPTYPGDVLTVAMWIEDGLARFQTVSQHGETVIDNGEFTFA